MRSVISTFKLSLALKTLENGGVIAYPTEGVWGLGCDPFNRHAVQRILKLKQRSMSKGLILVAASIEQIESALYAIDQSQRQILIDAWPGAQTFVIPDPAQLLPYWLRGRHQSIALRVTAHPQVRRLCQQFGPIVSTSANPSNLIAATSQLKVRQYFKNELDFILPGGLMTAGKSTSIKDLKSATIIRS